MNRPSNRMRSRISRRLWGKLREIGGETIELRNDSGRYEVSKFDIDVVGDKDVVRDVRDRLLALLTIQGWTIERNQPYFDNIVLSAEDLGDIQATLGGFQDMHNGEVCLSVHIR